MSVYGEGVNMSSNFGKKWPALIALVVCAIVAACLPALAQQQAALATPANSVHAVLAAAGPNGGAPKSDSAAAQAAFNRAWTVFVSPRCQNCHPSGDAPLQGDDSHVHAQDVKRGVDGHGVTAMRCNTCHQDKNLPGADMPPGNPKWGLPPANNKMVF